jgi:predicted regulator of amino acid metabolism with ACT domain
LEYINDNFKNNKEIWAIIKEDIKYRFIPEIKIITERPINKKIFKENLQKIKNFSFYSTG